MPLGDRIKESTVTTGTGTYTLNGAVNTFQTFVSGIGTATGDTTGPWSDVPYTCIQSDASGANIDIEYGRGTLTKGTAGAADTLSRDSITGSSNGDSAVDWGAGTKTIVCAPQAADIQRTPRWHLTKSANQDLTTSTWTRLTFDGQAASNWSSGVTIDLPNNEVEILIAGYYWVYGIAGLEDMNGIGEARMACYGDTGTPAIKGDYTWFDNPDGASSCIAFAGERLFAANEKVSLWGFQSYGSNREFIAGSVSNKHPAAHFMGFWSRAS